MPTVMTRRRVVVIAAVLALLTSVVAGALIYGWEPEAVRVYRRIELGMTLGETIAAAGRQPDDLSVVLEAFDGFLGWTKVHQAGVLPEKWPRPTYTKAWLWHNHVIVVMFDAEGKAIYHELDMPNKLPLFERVKQWLGI